MAMENFPTDALSIFLQYLPKVAGAILVLIIGWIVGRLIGRGVSTILDKGGVDDALRKTFIGRAIERSGISSARFFDLVIRYFIYLIAIFAVVDILEISILSEFMRRIVEYLPSFIAGVFVLIFGLIAADWLGDALESMGKEAKLEFAHLFALGLRGILYFVILIVALTLMRIDVTILYIFAEALAWGMAVAVILALSIAIGWGFKDVITKNAPKFLKLAGTSVEGLEKKTVRKAKFEIYRDAGGMYRFRLKAPNYEIILVGESYKSKAACMNGVKSVKKNASIAEIEDQTG